MPWLPSPFLKRAGVPALRPNQAAVVLAPPGVGKTALLVHAALDTLRDGGAVLAALTQMNVPYKFQEGGDAVLVPAGWSAW